MKMIQTGPSGIVFTLASTAGREEILRTARRVFQANGMALRGALEVEQFVCGARAVVFAHCRAEALYRFDSISDAYDAALACPAIPAQLYRYHGSYYIATDSAAAPADWEPPAEPAEKREVLENGVFIADNVIEKIKAGAV